MSCVVSDICIFKRLLPSVTPRSSCSPPNHAIRSVCTYLISVLVLTQTECTKSAASVSKSLIECSLIVCTGTAESMRSLFLVLAYQI